MNFIILNKVIFVNKNFITVCAGDTSGDGHRETRSFTIISTFTPQQILDAYRRGSEKLDFDLEKSIDIADIEFGDNYKIPMSVVDKMLGFGVLKKDDLINDYFEEDGLFIDWAFYPDLWLKIAMFGNPDLDIEELPYTELNIGGYNLFSY